MTKKTPVAKKEAVELNSESRWRELGRKIKPNATPVKTLKGRYCQYGVYSLKQTTELRRVTKRSEEEIKRLAEITDVLDALFTLNRRAKRCRDLAKKSYRNRRHGTASNYRDEKLYIYDCKGQSLHYLVSEGRLAITGYHKFPGGHFAELLEGDGYRFHRPCERPGDEIALDTVSLDGDIEAKPKGKVEPLLAVAYEVIRRFLADRQTVEVYVWPERESLRTFRKKKTDDDDNVLDGDDGDEEYDRDNYGSFSH